MLLEIIDVGRRVTQRARTATLLSAWNVVHRLERHLEASLCVELVEKESQSSLGDPPMERYANMLADEIIERISNIDPKHELVRRMTSLKCSGIRDHA